MTPSVGKRRVTDDKRAGRSTHRFGAIMAVREPVSSAWRRSSAEIREASVFP